ncbi:hypothetical protein FD755_018176, partial [Muntiacus reevesi]
PEQDCFYFISLTHTHIHLKIRTYYSRCCYIFNLRRFLFGIFSCALRVKKSNVDLLCKTAHADGYYGAWPGWAVSISMLPLTLPHHRQFSVQLLLHEHHTRLISFLLQRWDNVYLYTQTERNASLSSVSLALDEKKIMIMCKLEQESIRTSLMQISKQIRRRKFPKSILSKSDKTDNKVKRIGPHIEIFQVFRGRKKFAITKNIIKMVTVMQAFVRGWLERKRFQRIMIKALYHGPDLRTVINMYCRQIHRVKYRLGLWRTRQIINLTELEEWMDRKKFYETMFAKREDWQGLERSELLKYFNDCGHFPTHQQIDEVWDLVHRARQTSLSITNSRSPPKPMSMELVMASYHLILCRPLLLLPLIFPPSGSFPMSQFFTSEHFYENWNFLHVGLIGKESACQCRRHGFDPWVGKIPWKRKWQPVPVVLLRKSLGTWWATGP